jgi:tripartite motif-containing protein 71
MKAFILLSLIVIFTQSLFATSTPEEYEFVEMWPKLEQDWYFSKPVDVAVDADGIVHVADGKSFEIRQLSPDGKPVGQWGKTEPDGTERPFFSIAFDSKGIKYAADGACIKRFDKDGKYLDKWVIGDVSKEMFFIGGIAINANDSLYATDTMRNCVFELDSDGKIVSRWGTAGKGKGEFTGPRDIAVDAKGNIYIADTENNRIQKLSAEGKYISELSAKGKNKLQTPFGVFVDNLGNIYVSDTGNMRIIKYDSSGKLISAWSTKGKGNEVSIPAGLCADGQGNIYVADMGSDSIKKYTIKGKLIQEWGPRTAKATKNKFSLSYPMDIEVDSKGFIYVIDGTYDEGNARVVKFDPRGNVISEWKSPLKGSSFEGIGLDEKGNIYLADCGRVLKLNSDGKLAQVIGKKGEGPGELDSVYDVAVDGKGNIYICNTTRIQRFDSDGRFVKQWGKYINDPEYDECRKDGEFYIPYRIYFDHIDSIYVCEERNRRIQKITTEGAFIRKWDFSKPIKPEEGIYPSSTAVDEKENLFILDRARSKVVKMNLDGIVISEWGGEGFGKGKLNHPEGIAVDSSGTVYVADTENHRIQVFKSKKK